MLVAEGDHAGWRAACREMKKRLEGINGPVLIAHHGDGDGMTGGGILSHWFKSRGIEVRYASSPEFRLKDLDYFEKASADCEDAVFVEAQGMPPEYARLDAKFLNIDHHPYPAEFPIRRMLNPRMFGLEPNPAAALVIHELLREDLPARAEWLAALASIVDYCPDAARDIIDAHAGELRDLENLRDTFLATQYVSPLVEDLADLISELPSPEELLAAEPYRSRRELYRELLHEAKKKARVGRRLVVADTGRSAEETGFRISSPLANALQELYNDRCVVVVESLGAQARFSVRYRAGGLPLGKLLAGIAARLGAGDGSGHEKAASARVPVELKDRFLKELEEEIGR